MCICIGLGKLRGSGKSSKKKPKPVASVAVAITTPGISSEIVLGDDYRATVGGTWTGTNLGSNQVYLQITDSSGTFLMPQTQLGSGGVFKYSMPLNSNVGPGARSGTFMVKACQDAQCAQPYANASASVNYQLQVFEPSLTLAITSPAIVDMVDLGDSENFTAAVAGTWSATHLGSNKVFVHVSDDAGTFATPAPQLQAAGSNAFSFALPLASGLTIAPRSGLLTVRACKDALCTQPYANTVTSVSYQLEIMRIAEWETHQRNASHDGYVPVTLDPTKFAKVWEWQPKSAVRQHQCGGLCHRPRNAEAGLALHGSGHAGNFRKPDAVHRHRCDQQQWQADRDQAEVRLQSNYAHCVRSDGFDPRASLFMDEAPSRRLCRTLSIAMLFHRMGDVLERKSPVRNSAAWRWTHAPTSGCGTRPRPSDA